MTEGALEILQLLRIKGLAEAGDLATALGRPPAAIEPRLAALAEAGLLARSEADAGGGWMLTPEGLRQQERLATEWRQADAVDGVKLAYEVFLDLNATVKELVSEWQAGSQGEAEAADVLEELAEIDSQLAEGLTVGARSEPRLGVYSTRLAAALERAREGDSRYIDDPLLPSFHTVWFECHEDLLQILGRTRAEEGQA
jgi:hypothetical protein